MSLEESIIAIATDIYTQLGSGHSEAAYQKAMEVALRLKGIRFEAQKVIELRYRDHYIGEENLDLVVAAENDRLILELKTLSTLLGIPEQQQLRNYMQQMNIEKGLLINFPQPGRNRVPRNALEVKRISLSQPLTPSPMNRKKGKS